MMRPSLVWLCVLTRQALCMCAYAQNGGEVLDEHGELKKRAIVSPEFELQVRDLPQDRVLLGDLRQNISTPTGQNVADILLGKASGLNTVPYSTTPPSTPAACAADPCCKWYNVSAAILQAIRNDGGGCNGLGAQFVRGGFHDASTWSIYDEAAGGGADGSLILNADELGRFNNKGLGKLKPALMPIYQKYKVGMADLIQYASIIATLHCTQGPRLRAWVGRKDSSLPSKMGMLPQATQGPAYLIQMFANRTIIREDMIALLGAHTISRQYFFNTSKSARGLPQDTSPELWDVLYYTQMMQQPNPFGPPALRFPSDVALAKYSTTAPFFQKFAASQAVWNEAYADAYVRVMMLGVNNINNLTECSQTVPNANNE